MEIPVYLFTGFLESGKTKFIQETLEDKNFNEGDKTLLLVCEEGIDEYDTSKFPFKNKNVFIEIIDEVDEINPTTLKKFETKYGIERVVVEYNGMWPIGELYNNIPKNWIVYQEIMVADSQTFITYNANMRQQMFDKIQGAELIILNRANNSIDKEEIHKIIRGISRRITIAYEYPNGEVEYDEIEDPLPFDKEADEILIADRDFALFYREICEKMDDYDGKTVKFKGLLARNEKLDSDTTLIGRHVMTCCEADIEYKPIICTWDKPIPFENKTWVILTAVLKVEKHKLYQAKGPVLHVVDACVAPKPEQEIATFY